ncbi:MAG: FAD-dependent oxidoreductase [Proteobacteria bacterium]|nr:FAD-dependent oxidoreductase [Pseudomonadota bacterium]MCP4920239.1 FAD-dependent oxidoreductase [Pseudomonadota bacterium]
MAVTVIGGGIFGVTAALALRIRGHEVDLFDPDSPHPDAASTDISKVVRADYGADDTLTALGRRALLGWREWNSTFSRPLFHEEGFLLLSRTQMEPGGFEHESFRRQPNLRRVAPGFREAHPDWNADAYPDGYFNPAGGWAESGEVVRQLGERARAAGVRIVAEQTTVERVAGPCVVAAGAWTHHLLPELADRLRAVGQPVLHFRPQDPDPFRWRAPRFPVWAADISRTGWYGFPANADGLVKVANHGVGIEVDPTGPREVPPEWEERFRAFLRESIPALAHAPRVGERLCLYSDSFDGDFLIDRVPGRSDVFVAAGGSGHGFKFAPVLGELIADVVDGLAPHPRFAWRELGERRTEDARHA